MALKVLIAPDKFKGTLTAPAAANAIARGWRRVRPADSLRLLPFSDGGDGFGELMGKLYGAKRQTTETVDAAHRRIRAHWWWSSRNRTAVIESAEVIGLARLPAKKYHPFALDTFGLGKVLLAAQQRGARRCLVGIGGSATNDGGFGLARALGWEFLDRNGQILPRWIHLRALVEIRPPPQPRLFPELSVAVDVQNPLLGPRGSSRVYGPQKGLTPKDLPLAEACLRRLASVAKRRFGREFSREPGAGAAGGLGFGLLCFLGARLEPGFDLFAREARLAQCLRWAELVITGEGAIDNSTFMGKGVGEIARLCRRMKTQCIALAGIIKSRGPFDLTYALTDLTTATQARKRPAIWLSRAASQAAGMEFKF